MIPIVSIVEGDGEVQALPVLLRRMAEWRPSTFFVNPLPPIRVRRDRFINKEEEFHKQLLLAAAKAGDEGWILILLDADDDCPKDLGESLRLRAEKHIPHRRFSIVLANREFEAWFIAAAESLDGRRNFHVPAAINTDPESFRDAKGWMRQNMTGNIYRELLDQPAFAAAMNLDQAEQRSRSFRKLCKEWQIHIQSR